MTDLTKRRLSIVAAGLVLVIAIIGRNYLIEQKEEAPRKKPVTHVKQAETMLSEQESIATTLDVQGQLMAFDKVELYSEVGGVVLPTGRTFKVGTYFPKGSPLLRIDDTETRLSLLAQKSSLMNAIAQAMPDLKIDYPESFPGWENYLNGFDVETAIADFPEPKTNQEKRFLAARNLYTQFYNIKSQEERLQKFTIYAPFGGVLTAAAVQPGTVIRTGQKLGELMAAGRYELVATVPLADLNHIKVGNAVAMKSEDIEGEWQGRIKRISDQIDPGSQTVQVFIGVAGDGLREGMYLRGAVAARTVEAATRIPRELLTGNEEVFEVTDSLLTLRKVKVIKMESGTAIVQGIPSQTPLLAKKIPGAFEGMKVAPYSKEAENDTSEKAIAAPAGVQK